MWNCHWEVHGSICSHCGTRFRRSTRNINGESEEDEDEEDDDEMMMMMRMHLKMLLQDFVKVWK